MEPLLYERHEELCQEIFQLQYSPSFFSLNLRLPMEIDLCNLTMQHFNGRPETTD